MEMRFTDVQVLPSLREAETNETPIRYLDRETCPVPIQ
jgi:hypothetical protein